MVVRRSALPGAACALVAAALAAPASAAPPGNDARAAAQDLRLPADVRGTTVEATIEPGEPMPCAADKSSVWYELSPSGDRPVLVALDAAGDLDATVAVLERQRSQLLHTACSTTSRRGRATVEFDARRGAVYLVRLASLANSADDAFRLRVVEPDPPARAPGDRLPAGGVAGSVDRIANPDDAWAVRLRKGVTYRINLVSRAGCTSVDLYAPGTRSFADAATLRSLRCDRHTLFTPESSGRHSLRVVAPRGTRDPLPYRLRVGRAGADDTAPGRVLANDRRVRGRLQGSELDAVDLYRFALARPSLLRLGLRTGADLDLMLLDEHGRRRACDCGRGGAKEIERRVGRGRYFAVVRARNGADGRYVLSRLARTITRAQTTVADRSLAPGATALLGLRVKPAVSGPTTLTVERFDPLAGWLFDARLHPRLVAGTASAAFRPPTVGRWRVTGSFDGTRLASPSAGGTATFEVAEPLPPAQE